MKKVFLKLIKILATKREIIFLGSKYGGWHFYDHESIKNSFVISAGVGTDVSFDIELMQKYNTKIVFIDPTPESIIHLTKVINAIGKSKNQDYSDDGKQSINAYNLENLNKDYFLIEEYALYNSSKDTVKFYKPKNNKHISHSISNWQNNYSQSTPYIEVSTINLNSIIKKYFIEKISILKLDIEGAEYPVLISMLKDNIHPVQILVEFDELHLKKFKNYLKYFNLILKLIKYYELIETKNYPNFLFVKKSY